MENTENKKIYYYSPEYKAINYGHDSVEFKNARHEYYKRNKERLTELAQINYKSKMKYCEFCDVNVSHLNKYHWTSQKHLNNINKIKK